MLLLRGPDDREHRGQALVEFALVLPILVLILLGIMQFGLLFWGQITLTQVARDTGRWAATQQECDTAGNRATLLAQARAIADEASLYGFGGGADPDLTITPSWAPNAAPCPPADNTSVEWVTIGMTYRVDVFLPLAADTCTPNCQRTLATEVQFRMEPEPQP
jgi:Flp pilus assembly protein TadG